MRTRARPVLRGVRDIIIGILRRAQESIDRSSLFAMHQTRYAPSVIGSTIHTHISEQRYSRIFARALA